MFDSQLVALNDLAPSLLLTSVPSSGPRNVGFPKISVLSGGSVSVISTVCSFLSI